MADTDRYDRVAKRAKEIWEAEGRPEGRAGDHWMRAEKEIADAEATSAMPHETAVGAAPAKKPRAKPTPKADKSVAPARTPAAKPAPAGATKSRKKAE